MTLGLAIVVGIALTIVGVVRVGTRRKPERPLERLNQSDPIVRAAVEEVDALVPAFPLLDPDIVRAEAREKMKKDLAAAKAFFGGMHRVPIWNRKDVASYQPDGFILMKDGRCVHEEAVALMGWDAALARAPKLGDDPS